MVGPDFAERMQIVDKVTQTSFGKEMPVEVILVAAE